MGIERVESVALEAATKFKRVVGELRVLFADKVFGVLPILSSDILFPGVSRCARLCLLRGAASSWHYFCRIGLVLGA